MPFAGSPVRRRSVKSSARSMTKKLLRQSRKLTRIAARPYGGLSTLVRRIANRGIETKHIGQNVVNAAFNSTISAASECYPLLPQVGEGTAGHQRIGDRVKAKYLLVKGKLMYDAQVQGDYIPPSTVRLMILSQKNIKVSSDVSSRTDVTHLLKDNIGTDVGRAYVGGPFDNLAPINKDLFVVHMDRKVKMRAQIEKQMGNSNTVLGYATQKTYTFVKKIRIPSTLTFDDGNGDYPNNAAPFFCMGAVCDDNNAAWSVNTPYRVVVQAELYFTDP